MLCCSDTKDAVVLYHDFYLKPVACINISLQLPALKSAGKSLSNWEVVEQIKSAAKPDEFIRMKVLESTLQFVQIEAQLESRHQIAAVLQRLDHGFFRLNGFQEPVKMRAHETKIRYPSRHDWDTFFQEKDNMNEMKAGERPDTVHISMLPCQWFSTVSVNGERKVKPSETLIREIFQVFGPLRAVDVPMLDPYRSNMVLSANNTFAFEQDGLFDVYIQYQEYMGFVECITALKGKKLLLKKSNQCQAALIQVDFDRTRHLSDAAIKNRKKIREKLIQEEIDRERLEKARRDLDMIKQEETRKQIEENTRKEEDRKLILIQRKLESLRLLDALLERIKVSVEEKEREKKKAAIHNMKDVPKKKEKLKRAEKELRRQRRLEEKEKLLRSKLVQKYQEVEQQRLEEQLEKLRKATPNSTVKNSVSVVADSKISNHVDMTEERVVCYAAKDSTTAASTSAERSRDRWHNSSPGDPRPNQSKSHHRKTGHDDYRSIANRMDRNSDPSNHQHQHQQQHYKQHQQHHYHHDASQNRKRHLAPPYQPNWKRNRPDWKNNPSYPKKSNRMAQLDDELWDGPNMNPGQVLRRYRPHDTFGRNGRRPPSTKETSKDT